MHYPGLLTLLLMMLLLLFLFLLLLFYQLVLLGDVVAILSSLFQIWRVYKETRGPLESLNHFQSRHIPVGVAKNA